MTEQLKDVLLAKDHEILRLMRKLVEAEAKLDAVRELCECFGNPLKVISVEDVLKIIGKQE